MVKKVLIWISVFLILPVTIIAGLFLAFGKKTETTPFEKPSIESLTKANLSQIATPTQAQPVGIGVLSGSTLKIPLFEDTVLNLGSDTQFKVGGKSFAFVQSAPILSEDTLVLLPFTVTEDETKVSYFFITSFIKTGEKYLQKQSIFLGNAIKMNAMDLSSGILHTSFLAPAKGKKELDDTAVAYSKYFRYINGQVAPYYPNINNGDIKGLAIIQNLWAWKETIGQDGKKVTPSKPGIFTLKMNEEGDFAGTTDCNGIIGKFTMDETGALFDDIAMTKMKCQNPEEQNTFASYLRDSKTYELNDTEFILKLDNGSKVVFEKTASK